MYTMSRPPITVAPLKGYPKYSATSDGRIINTDTGLDMALRSNHDGYMVVTLKMNGRSIPKTVHTLVLAAFRGGPPDDGQVYSCDHCDRNRSNNDISNLRWATAVQQAQNSVRCMLRPGAYRPVMVTDAAGTAVIYPTMATAMSIVAPDKHPCNATVYAALKTGNPALGYQWEYAPPPAGVYMDIPVGIIHGNTGYKASDTGFIMTPTGRVTAGSLGNDDYASVNIAGREYRVHRLVAATFLPCPSGGMDRVIHKNGIKTDNRSDNLAWVTATGQALHMVQLGRAHIPTGRQVAKYTIDGALVASYPSVADAARAVDCATCRSNIVACCMGRQKTAYGFVWVYV